MFQMNWKIGLTYNAGARCGHADSDTVLASESWALMASPKSLTGKLPSDFANAGAFPAAAVGVAAPGSRGER
jgi:hypothetical protein